MSNDCDKAVAHRRAGGLENPRLVLSRTAFVHRCARGLEIARVLMAQRTPFTPRKGGLEKAVEPLHNLAILHLLSGGL